MGTTRKPAGARPARAGSTGTSHVALMRGINVGGKNMLSMQDLAAAFAEEGCTDVRTYINSGNVIFNAAPRTVTRLAERVAERLLREHGLTVPVVLRSRDELERVTRSNPFLKSGTDPDWLHVLFLADEPKRAVVAGLDPKRSPPDRFEVVGGDIYLSCPNGVARTKLTNAYFDSRLGTIST